MTRIPLRLGHKGRPRLFRSDNLAPAYGLPSNLAKRLGIICKTIRKKEKA